MDKIKILALMGAGGAGKDYILNEIFKNKKLVEKYNLHKIVSCTTREKRENEIEDVSYHYVTKKYFNDNAYMYFMEISYFKDNYYGTRYEDVDKNKINVGVFNPAGVKELSKREDIEVLPVVIEAPIKMRIERMINRERGEEACLEACRRVLADYEDFGKDSFGNYPHFLNVGNVYPENLFNLIEVKNFVKN